MSTTDSQSQSEVQSPDISLYDRLEPPQTDDTHDHLYKIVSEYDVRGMERLVLFNIGDGWKHELYVSKRRARELVNEHNWEHIPKNNVNNGI
jgi:hypothetical protein